MSKNLGRTAYVIALAALKKKGTGGGGGPSQPSESVYEYATKHGVTNLPETQFNLAWKVSLNPKPFVDQLMDYLVSIGYTGDKNNVNKWMLSLVNGELKPTESFYDSMAKLGFSNKSEIDIIMTKLLNGTLVLDQLYNDTKAMGYDKTFVDFKDRLYYLFTEEFINKNDLDEAIKNNNPYTYAKDNKLISDTMTQDDFNKNYKIAVNNTYIYNYAQTLIPTITNIQVDKIMFDLLSGNFYNKTLYQHLVDECNYTGTEAQANEWLLKLVNKQLESPWMLAQRLGNDITPPQTEEEFNYMYKQLLINYTVDAGTGDKFDGDWTIPEPIEPEIFDIYKFYQSIGYQGSESQLYSALYTLANMLISGGNSSNDDLAHEDDIYSGDFKIPETPSQKTLYQLYLEIATNPMSEKDFNKRFNDYMEEIITIDGMDADKNNMPQEFNGDFSDNPVGFIQKSLYELYKDILDNPNNLLTEKEFNNKFNKYMASLLPDTVEGGDATDTGLGKDEFNGDWTDDSINITQKDLYELFLDCGMDKNDISEADFNKKMADLAGKSNLPYGISGEGEDEYNGTFNVPENENNSLKNITGGNADGTGPGGSEFFGDFSGSPTTQNFYTYMQSIGFTKSKQSLDEQILNLANGYLTGVLNGDNADDTDNIPADEKYEGNFDASNVMTPEFVQYMRSLGWSGDEKELGQRMLDFGNGLVDGTIDGNR